MFKDRQPLYVVVPPFMPDAKLMHSCCTFAQVNLSIDRPGPLATVRNDKLLCCHWESEQIGCVTFQSVHQEGGGLYELQTYRARAGAAAMYDKAAPSM